MIQAPEIYGGRVFVVDHPLISHKLSVIRDETTPPSIFRQTVRELALLEGFASTQNLKTHGKLVRTIHGDVACQTIKGQEPVFVPILRAGMGFLDAMLELVPTARVGHLGMFRDEETFEPIEYYAKLPEDIDKRPVIVLDPMLATGGSLKAAIQALRKRGVKDLVCQVLVAAPEGIEALLSTDPDVCLYTCAIDEGLDEHAYIVPGLGDAGDRIYNSGSASVESVFAHKEEEDRLS